MFPTLFRRIAEATPHPEAPAAPAASPYQLRKVWPPDFTQLSSQAQLRFEKKYKRRVALKHARPRWNKAIKLIQLVTITGFLGALFFSEINLFGQPYRPSERAMNHIRNLWGGVDPKKRYERPLHAPAPPSQDQNK